MASHQTLENPNPKNNIDRFSDLPDCLIHRILSFVDEKHVDRMRSMSKRFQQVCSPYLSFTSKPCDYYGAKQNCRRFTEFLDKFWSRRGSKTDAASIDIARLHIEWTCTRCEFNDKDDSVLGAWIGEAVKRNVQELNLKLGRGGRYFLPECIFNCETLTVLKIVANCVSLPMLVFHSLRVLSLQCPCPSDKVGLSAWISNSCPSLKQLSVTKLKEGKLIITSSSLEALAVSLDHIDSNSSYDITILAENLKTLSLDLECYSSSFAYKAKHIVLINAPRLHDFTLKADLRTCEYSGEFMSLRSASINVPAKCNYLVALHRSIVWAKSLQISVSAFETLFKNGHCGQLLIENLQYLILIVDSSSNDEFIPSIISFVKLLLNLKSLTIKHLQPRYGGQIDLGKYIADDVEHFEPRNNLMTFHSLKEVVIELSTGTKEIELIKYLLKYAQNLEKVTVCYPTSNLFDMIAQMDIRKFEIASTWLELFSVQKEIVREEQDEYY